MFPDRHAPLHAFACPFARDFQQPLGDTDACGRQRQPASVQRRERDFQSRALFRDHVFARHAHVRELHDGVVKGTEPHEPAAIRDLEPGCRNIDNERRDLLAFFAANYFRRRLRHDHEHASFHAIGAPKFFAIQDELGAVGRRIGAETHGRRVGAGVRFG